MDEKFRIISTRLLAVEGKDECNFFDALLKFEQIIDVQTVDIGGKDKFPLELPLLMNLEGFSKITTLGFVRDAEIKQAQSAFDSICNTLRKFNLPYPRSIGDIQPGSPKVGVFIMPNNQGAGMLEDLCLMSLKDQKISECLDTYIVCAEKCMSDSELEKFNVSKARVQSYLATRVPIVNSLGNGALNHHWDFNHPCFADVKNFLCQLFD